MRHGSKFRKEIHFNYKIWIISLTHLYEKKKQNTQNRKPKKVRAEFCFFLTLQMGHLFKNQSKHWFMLPFTTSKRKPECFAMKDSNVTNKTHDDAITNAIFRLSGFFFTIIFFLSCVNQVNPPLSVLFQYWESEPPHLCNTAAHEQQARSTDEAISGRRSLYNRSWLIPISGHTLPHSLTFMLNNKKERGGGGGGFN